MNWQNAKSHFSLISDAARLRSGQNCMHTNALITELHTNALITGANIKRQKREIVREEIGKIGIIAAYMRAAYMIAAFIYMRQEPVQHMSKYAVLASNM